MRNLLTTLIALSTLAATSSYAAANHETAYLAKNYRAERKALSNHFDAREDALRCAHRDALAAIRLERKHASRLCSTEKRVVYRELDRRRAAEMNAYRFATRELDAELRAERGRLAHEYRATRDAIRRPVVVARPVVLNPPVVHRVAPPIRVPVPAVRVERHIHVEPVCPTPVADPCFDDPYNRHSSVDVPRLIGGILDMYLSVR